MTLRPFFAATAVRRAAGAAMATVVSVSVLASPARADVLFGSPVFPPGDMIISAAAGMQVECDVARGGDTYLAVWSDGRSTPDDYWPFATEGSGTDIYAVRLDASGNPIDAVPLVIDQALGDQVEPQVAWNGENWLVVWKSATVTLPTYERLEAVRVAPDGTVLDPTPITVHDDESFYDWNGPALEGGDGEWIVTCQANGPVVGLLAIRITGEGAVANPGGELVHDTFFSLDFDVAFAGDEYLFVWGGPFDAPRGRLFGADLTPLGPSFPIPFSDNATSDGTDFLVVRASGSGPLATVDAVRITHDGLVPDPVFTIDTSSAGTCCANVTWDGTYYWVSWGQLSVARVEPDGTLVDPGGVDFDVPASYPISTPRFAGVVGGGLQLVWNHGVSGADYPKDVFTARVDTAAQLGDETVISTGAPAQVDAELAAGDEVNLLVYRSRTSDAGRILAHRIDDTGAALDAEPIEVATGPIPGLGVPSLGGPGAAWNGSNFMITWSDGLQIFARRMLPDGTFLDPTPLVVMDGFDPDVAAVGSIFLVVGIDFLSDNPQWQATHSMRVDGTTGLSLDAEPNALGGFAIFAQHPHVVSWADRWLVVWQRNISHDNPAAGTTVAFVDADGTTPGLIEAPVGWRPEVAVAGDRALLVAVTQTIASATTDLAGAILLADGTFPDPAFTISSAADKQLMPTATWNGSEFIVAWEDKRSSVIYFDERTDIYAARIGLDGAVLDPGGVAAAAATVPEIQPALLSVGGRTLLAVSTLLSDAPHGSYRIGIHSTDAIVAVGDGPSTSMPPIHVLNARPNPMRASTVIRFHYDVRHPASLRIFDSGGRLVRTVFEQAVFTPGEAPIEVTWDARDDTRRFVEPGVYFYELRSAAGATGGRLVRLE